MAHGFNREALKLAIGLLQDVPCETLDGSGCVVRVQRINHHLDAALCDFSEKLKRHAGNPGTLTFRFLQEAADPIESQYAMLLPVRRLLNARIGQQQLTSRDVLEHNLLRLRRRSKSHSDAKNSISISLF